MAENTLLRCLVRQTMVKALPEERVRQSFLHYLIEDLAYPQESLGVEVPLSYLPHLARNKGKLPDRRADIIVFRRDGGDLVPLLLVECKASAITDRVVSQVVGYNVFVRTPFISIVNHDEVHCGRWDPSVGPFLTSTALPTFTNLIQLTTPAKAK